MYSEALGTFNLHPTVGKANRDPTHYNVHWLLHEVLRYPHLEPGDWSQSTSEVKTRAKSCKCPTYHLGSLKQMRNTNPNTLTSMTPICLPPPHTLSITTLLGATFHSFLVHILPGYAHCAPIPFCGKEKRSSLFQEHDQHARGQWSLG